jgi:sugar lactone lactonase YvrE
LLQAIPEGFSAPRGLALSSEAIYIADTANSRIVKLDNKGKLVSTGGSRTPADQHPPKPGTFVEPWGLAVDTQGNIFTVTGEPIAVFEQGVSQPDSLLLPTGITLGPDGTIWLTDAGNNRVIQLAIPALQ